MGEDFGSRYDAILGQDFWRDRGATVDYCNREITMGEVVMHFDDSSDETADSTQLLTVISRTERVVRLLTKPSGIGIISNGELAPGVYLGETLTEAVDSYSVTSIVNATEYVTIEPTIVELEEVQNGCEIPAFIFLLR
jgi:hypothetical protein